MATKQSHKKGLFRSCGLDGGYKTGTHQLTKLTKVE